MPFVLSCPHMGLFAHVANLVAQLIARYREIQREGGQGSQLSVRAPISGVRMSEPLQYYPDASSNRVVWLF